MSGGKATTSLELFITVCAGAAGPGWADGSHEQQSHLKIHSGLGFDIVYLIDDDEQTWRNNPQITSLPDTRRETMKTTYRSMQLIIASLALLLCASAAQAQATRTWVSGVGDDANPCSRTAPCKTFAGAISTAWTPQATAR